MIYFNELEYFLFRENIITAFNSLQFNIFFFFMVSVMKLEGKIITDLEEERRLDVDIEAMQNTFSSLTK